MPGPKFQLGGRKWSAYQVLGCMALALGVTLNLTLCMRLKLSFATSVAISIIGLLTIPLLALAIKIVTGKEQLAFYHHLIAALAVTAAFLWVSGQPIFPFLDPFILSCGAIHALGCCGCLMAGCCHGRPFCHGVAYGQNYLGVLPHDLLDKPLFPIQLVESLWTFTVVIAGCVLISNPHLRGAGFGWFIATYCPARFCFEFARWPPSYQFKWGLSQYQWISVVLVLLAAGLEFTGALPFQRWHIGVAIVLLLATAVAVLERRLRSFDKDLNHPEHLRELASAIDLACWRAEVMQTRGKTIGHGIPLSTTSLGLRISASRIFGVKGELYHYAFSSLSGRLSDATASVLAKLIVGWKHPSGRPEVVKGSRGVFHLLIHSIKD